MQIRACFRGTWVATVWRAARTAVQEEQRLKQVHHMLQVRDMYIA